MASRRERRRRREARDAGRRGALLATAASWKPAAPPILPLAPSYVDVDSDTPLFTAVCVDRDGLPVSPAGTVWGCPMYEAVVDELDQQPPWHLVVSCPPSAVSGVAALIAAITEPTALLEAVHG